MADRTSAEIFGNIFEYCARNQSPETVDLAKWLWGKMSNYDFSPDQMDADQPLIELGLATKTPDGVKYHE